MTADFTLRRAEMDDRDRLTDLCLRSKRSNGYDDAFMAQCVEELSVKDSWVLEDDFWLAEAVDGTPVGCIRLSVEEDGVTGEVGTCFVDPDWQGKKVGQTLFRQLFAEAGKRKLKRLGLDSDPFAEAFYARMGFKTVGRSPSGSIPGRTLPRMELVLEHSALR